MDTTLGIVSCFGAFEFYKIWKNNGFWIFVAFQIGFVRLEFQKSPLECKQTSSGAEYRGTMSVTEWGLPCQRWDLQGPHTHAFTSDLLFPDSSLERAGASCRNPGGTRARPWCYIDTAAVRWQFCNVPDCGCRKSRAGWDYSGRISVTSSGRKCQHWSSQLPHAQSYNDPSDFPDSSIGEAQNFCRNPDRWETKGPWCYTTDSSVRWEYCNVPYCECKVSSGGHQYGGKISRTRSGLKCQRWDAQTPHAHKYSDHSCAFPDGLVSNAGDYCRNPEPNDLVGPWCFTMDPNVRWEYCEIPDCDEDGQDTEEGAMNITRHVNHTIVHAPAVLEVSRLEIVFLGLFVASLILAVTTIAAAVTVVHVYRKQRRRRACALCRNDIQVTAEENMANLEVVEKSERQSLKSKMKPKEDVYIDPRNIEGSSNLQHTYDTISCTSVTVETASQSRDTCSNGHVTPDHVSSASCSRHHGNLYENAPFHVIITPKTGRKEPHYERSSSA